MLTRALLALSCLVACGGHSVPERSAPNPSACVGCGDGSCTAQLRAPEDLTALSACTTFRGNLVVSGAALTHVDQLASLRTVEGSLTVGPTSKLSSLTGLARLETVRGDFALRGNFTLLGAFLPALTEVRQLDIVDNSAIETVSLHRLGLATSVLVERNRSLSRLDLSSLALVLGDLRGTDNPELADVALPKTLAVSGELWIETPKAKVTPPAE